jgi:hypothetical protein
MNKIDAVRREAAIVRAEAMKSAASTTAAPDEQ